MGRTSTVKAKAASPKPAAGDDRLFYGQLREKPTMPEDVLRRLFEGVPDPLHQKYLVLLAHMGNRSRAARALGISPAAVWFWRHDDKKFAAAYDKAMDIAVDLQEDEMIRRACEGVLEPVFQGGQLVGSVRKYSDGLLQFSLKGNRADKYAERHKVDIKVDLAERLRRGRERVLNRVPTDDD